MKPKDTAPDAGKGNRRGFLKSGAASIAVGLSGGVIAPRVSGEVMANQNSPLSALAVQDAMPTRNLGQGGGVGFSRATSATSSGCHLHC